MFAVIKTGGKQYRVAANDVIAVAKLEGEPGAEVTFGEVVMMAKGDSIELGAPLLKDVSVTGEVVEQKRGPKVIAFKKRRRQNSRRKRGHRQDFTLVRITAIAGEKAEPKARKAPKAAAAPAEDSGEAGA